MASECQQQLCVFVSFVFFMMHFPSELNGLSQFFSDTLNLQENTLSFVQQTIDIHLKIIVN